MKSPPPSDHLRNQRRRSPVPLDPETIMTATADTPTWTRDDLTALAERIRAEDRERTRRALAAAAERRRIERLTRS